MGDHKFAERLTVLAGHVQGLLGRVYRVKQIFGAPETRPALLAEKGLAEAIKAAVKKFPAIDMPNTPANPLVQKREALLDVLDEAYFTFVDVLQFKDAFYELVTSLSAKTISLNLGVNTALTAVFLNVLADYVALILLLARIDDRRIIVALYSGAHELAKGAGDPMYPRLSQIIVDYEQPLKRLPEDFMPHNKMLSYCLQSVLTVFLTRFQSGEALRKGNVLSIAHNPLQMAQPARLDRLHLTPLSLDGMVRWIVLGYLAIPHELGSEDETAPVFDKFLAATSDGFAVTLFRSEVEFVHAAVEASLATAKDHKKLKSQRGAVAEQLHTVMQNAPTMHASRRVYLRQSLGQLLLLLRDKPALLAPKFPVVLEALTLARDEVAWLMRHAGVPGPKSRAKTSPEQYIDTELPELLFNLFALHELVLQHKEIVQRYYLEYITGFDFDTLRALIEETTLNAREETLLRFMADELATVPTTLDHATLDFQGLRLDYLRALATITDPHDALFGNERLVSVTHLLYFHCCAVDSLPQMLAAACSLSDLWFSKKPFQDAFVAGLKSPTQLRFLPAFAQATDTFAAGAVPAIPNERFDIGKDAANMANAFLGKIAAATIAVLGTVITEHLHFGEAMLPGKAADSLDKSGPAKKAKAKRGDLKTQPGLDVQGRSREQLAKYQGLQAQLADLCWALNRFDSITVFNIAFSPREFLTELLEQFFCSALTNLTTDDAVLVRPSVFLHRAQSLMTALRELENYINIDMATIFSNGLLDQTVVADGKIALGTPTVGTQYVTFYIQLLFTHVLGGGAIFSPARKAFLSRGPTAIKMEEFTDISEFRALCMILGPSGIKQLNEDIMFKLSSQIGEMKKLVIANRESLTLIKTKTDRVVGVTEALKRLTGMDEFLQCATLAGLVLNFRTLLSEALRSVLESRIPFIFGAIKDLHDFTAHTEALDELAMHAGIATRVDPLLLKTMQQHCANTDVEFNTWSLMMVMFAAALRALALQPQTIFHPALKAHDNNAHVIVTLICQVSAVVFNVTAPEPSQAPAVVTEAQRELLRVASICLLRMGGKDDRDVPRARDAVYILLDMIVTQSPFLTSDMFENYFPYSLVRLAYQGSLAQQSKSATAAKGGASGKQAAAGKSADDN